MQQEAFDNTEDFAGTDIVAGPGRVTRPGVDVPYANYELGLSSQTSGPFKVSDRI